MSASRKSLERLKSGRVPNGKIVEIEGDVPVGMKMDLDEFAEAISTRFWESVGRANWRRFEDARDFVCGLGLRSQAYWSKYCQSGKKPADIPTHPHIIYSQAGWLNWGDWFGTGRIADQLREHRPFKNARAYVHRLGLKSQAEWVKYCKSGKKPTDIPSSPEVVYAEAGWVGIGDWLGTGAVADHLRKYRSFKDARAFVRGLGLKSQTEWFEYRKSGKKPADIPANANRTYAEAGWSAGAIGSVRARLRLGYESIDLSKTPAPSCTTSV